jgi:hypothetical protein
VITEEMRKYAEEVLEALNVAFKTVAEGDVRRFPQLITELVTNLPAILEAFLTVTDQVEWPRIYKLFESIGSLAKRLNNFETQIATNEV